MDRISQQPPTPPRRQESLTPGGADANEAPEPLNRLQQAARTVRDRNGAFVINMNFFHPGNFEMPHSNRLASLIVSHIERQAALGQEVNIGEIVDFFRDTQNVVGRVSTGIIASLVISHMRGEQTSENTALRGFLSRRLLSASIQNFFANAAIGTSDEITRFTQDIRDEILQTPNFQARFTDILTRTAPENSNARIHVRAYLRSLITERQEQQTQTQAQRQIDILAAVDNLIDLDDFDA